MAYRVKVTDDFISVHTLFLIIAVSLLLGILISWFYYKSKKWGIDGKWIRRLVPVLLLIYPIFLVNLPYVSKVRTAEKSSETSLPNIILVTIDTLRADHLSCYGYKQITTPAIDALSREGVLFEKSVSQEPQTNPSHWSILTSKYPTAHGSLINGHTVNKNDFNLAELLLKKGYRTAAFVSSYVLDSSFGFDAGFQEYDDEFHILRGISKLGSFKVFEKIGLFDKNNSFERRGDQTNKRVFHWLEQKSRSPFFLWVHYFDPHAPYNPPAPYHSKFDPAYQGRFKEDFNFDSLSKKMSYSEGEITHIKALYDGEINFIDAQIHNILNKLRELNLYDNSIIVLTSDHGEDLMENGSFGHGDALFDTSIKVPLIIKFDKSEFSNRRVKDQVQSIDIMPTLLERLNQKAPKELQGNSLLSLIHEREKNKPKDGFSETHTPVASKTKYSIRNEKWKLIVTQEENIRELYDLEKDPWEQENLSTKGVIEEKLLEEKLKKWLKKNKMISKSLLNQKINREVINKLKNLGYFQ